MKLHNPYGILTLRVKNLAHPGQTPNLEKLSFDGIIWHLNFTNKWYSNTGRVLHILGLRFMKHYITEDNLYYSFTPESDKKLYRKYMSKNS